MPGVRADEKGVVNGIFPTISLLPEGAIAISDSLRVKETTWAIFRAALESFIEIALRTQTALRGARSESSGTAAPTEQATLSPGVSAPTEADVPPIREEAAAPLSLEAALEAELSELFEVMKAFLGGGSSEASSEQLAGATFRTLLMCMFLPSV